MRSLEELDRELKQTRQALARIRKLEAELPELEAQLAQCGQAEDETRVVLARELSLDRIAGICREIREQGIRGPSGELVKVEVFVHGALCVAISGKCYMSLAEFNSSANRGACFQSCRRKYTVRDAETGAEFLIDNHVFVFCKNSFMYSYTL